VAKPSMIRRRGGASPVTAPAPGTPLKSLGGSQSSKPVVSEPTTSLDELIHHRIRLGIVSALAATDSMTFVELKALLKTTDGNLSVHARKLEDARYIVCNKSFEDRRPRTDYRLAANGRQALNRYLNHMEALIRATRSTLER
jgi:DNA-binding MarR family transcriptional regulator